MLQEVLVEIEEEELFKLKFFDGSSFDILMKPGDSHLIGFKFVNLKEKVSISFDSGKDKEITVKSVRLCNRGSQGVIISKRKTITKIT